MNVWRSHRIDALLFVTSGILFLCGFFLEDRNVVDLPADFVHSMAPGDLRSMRVALGSSSLNVDGFRSGDGTPYEIRADGAIHVPATREVEAFGWALDGAHDPAAGVFVRVDRGAPHACRYGADRPDVAQHFHHPEARAAGFVCALGARSLVPGRHRVAIVVADLARRTYDVVLWPTTLVARAVR